MTCARPILEYGVLLKCFFIYLPTIKDLVGYYKFRNEVMVWFMEMICLRPIANDAEENPGPIIFHIIDPKSTYPADCSFFQSSDTGCLAFLTFRLFWAARTPIICSIYRYIFFLLL